MNPASLAKLREEVAVALSEESSIAPVHQNQESTISASLP